MSKKKQSRKSIHYGATEGMPRSTFGYLEGVPEAGYGKSGWRRVSTRQWIRDFREHISKYQTYPYKPICGCMFWSFGYYPDMVSKQSYQKYITKYPIPETRRASDTSEQVDTYGDEMAYFDEEGGPRGMPPPDQSGIPKNRESVTGITESESSVLPGDSRRKSKRKSKKGKGERESRTSLASDLSSLLEDGKKKKRKSKKGKLDKDESQATLAEDNVPRKSKSKKRKNKEDDDVSSVAESQSTVAEDKKKKKDKKSYAAQSEVSMSDMSDITTDQDKGKDKKKKKKKK